MVSSENPTGADNQQGSREASPLEASLTPQRLHAELLDAGAKGLEAYLQGALKDGSRNRRHGTHRIGQRERAWLVLLSTALESLGYRSWIYREGRSRRLWILETKARFLSLSFDPSPLAGTREGLCYARGYFDAEGGMPRSADARLYLQYTQKDRSELEALARVLASWDIECGRVHNPSRMVDPDYWRFYVRADSHGRFMRLVGSWHPRKRLQIETRMKI